MGSNTDAGVIRRRTGWRTGRVERDYRSQANGDTAVAPYHQTVPDAPLDQLRVDDDRVLLPVGAGVITQLQLDYAFGFTIEAWLHVRIEEPILVDGAAGQIVCEPGDPESITPLVDLHQAVVAEAAAGKDGSLTVVLADGRTLRVAPGDHYEAFTISGQHPGGDRFDLVSSPGGGLSSWSSTDASQQEIDTRIHKFRRVE